MWSEHKSSSTVCHGACMFAAIFRRRPSPPSTRYSLLDARYFEFGYLIAQLAQSGSNNQLCSMRLSVLREFALSLPHTTWVKQWGECLVFKIAGKMFLLIALGAETIDGVGFKC